MMVEGAAWAGEAAPQRCPPVLDGRRFAVERLEEDALDAADIDEVVSERALAGGIEAFATVAFTEGDELLAGAELGPGKRPLEELLGEGPDVRAEFARPAYDAVGSTQGVGCLLYGIDP